MVPSNLVKFASQVREMDTEPQSERFVRMFMERLANNCPKTLLRQLSECVIDFRKAEVRQEAEAN
ncbi:hypothetical protein PX52LOC_04535 [Limnoglobus roseus]|uniref:Uncharacterized protein n=1 Tax=Limnoglobus roseus TaxID=2598579 RepID=A0A5C1AG02_9BACT|nr:hypothetical protein PX52LOC_04535 [Limnoglobus roseus]